MTYIDEYLDGLDEPNKGTLRKIAYRIRKLVPGCAEVKSYGIPTFKYKGKNLIHLSNYNTHMSIYPGAYVIELFANDLAGFKISKGTIQFTVDNQISDELLEKIILACKNQIDQRS